MFNTPGHSQHKSCESQFNQLWDPLHQWQLNLVNAKPGTSLRGKMDVCSLKLASDFTCMIFSISAFFFIQLWWRRVWEAQEGEEYWAAAVFCLISLSFVLLKFPTLQKWPCFELRSECLKEGKAIRQDQTKKTKPAEIYQPCINLLVANVIDPRSWMTFLV